MLSKGKKIEYFCPVCFCSDIHKAMTKGKGMFDRNIFECNNCNSWGSWRDRLKRSVGKKD